MKYSAVIVLIFIFAGLTVQSQTYPRYIIVDQFGYLPESKKIAVIKNPLVGFDNTVHFTPGNSYSLVNATNGTVVFTAKPVSWKNGTTDVSSGDQTWHFDFSTVTHTGIYYILDVDNQKRSYDFRISPSVYN